MSLRLTCPRCRSQKVQPVHGDVSEGVVGVRLIAEWRCAECGESCENLSRRIFTWPTLDRAVGFVMLATFAYAAITLILQ